MSAGPLRATFGFIVIALGCLIPSVFLFFYQQKFGHHPIIIVFGQAAVLFVLASIGLATLAIGGLRSPATTKTCARFLGIAVAILFGALALIYTGAYVSNAIWGDTLNYAIVLTFASFSSVVVDFLPVSDEQKTMLIAGLAAAVAISLLAILVIALIASSRVVARVQPWLSDPVAGRRRVVGLSSALVAVLVISGAACVALAAMNLRLLYGEPLTAFLKLIPASSLLSHDNARVAAAIEDRDARATYKPPEQFTPKNVILILSDALRADRMGVYGYHRPTTPFLSDLYSKKLLHRVDMALSTCSETFCGISSTLASRPYHQITNSNFKLHSLLRDMGYRTNFFLSGNHRTWNYLFDYYGDEIDRLYDYLTLGVRDINDDRNVLEALERFPAADERPNFFFFFLMSSHVSGTKSPTYDRFQPSFTDRMRLVTFWNELAGTRRVSLDQVVHQRLSSDDLLAISNRYDNGILQTDAYLARIFAALEAKGYLRDSIVVILGDHGEGLGEHGHIGHTRYIYQEDIRIPLLIYDQDIARYRNSSFATQIDIAPTVVERLGLPVPKGWQGHSLMAPGKDRITLHQTRRGRSPCFAVVDKAGASLMKFIRCGSDALEELYDLVADPQERNNLVPSASARQLARYRRELDSRFSIVRNPCTSFECRD